MFDFIFNLNAKRLRQLKKAPAGPVRDFLSVPFPEPKTLINNVPILAIDFETTGLDPAKDQLLSMGFTEMIGGRIKLSTAQHHIINCEQALIPENVIIHQITEHEKQQGLNLNTATELLLEALAGKILLAHFAKIEITFLAQACRQLYGFVPTFPVIDTLVIAKRRLDMRQAHYDPSELRLSHLRERYNLPAHYAHNALNDAVATGELLLAELNHPGNQYQYLKDILK